jgi:hypothetical protein
MSNLIMDPPVLTEAVMPDGQIRRIPFVCRGPLTVTEIDGNILHVEKVEGDLHILADNITMPNLVAVQGNLYVFETGFRAPKLRVVTEYVHLVHMDIDAPNLVHSKGLHAAIPGSSPQELNEQVTQW